MDSYIRPGRETQAYPWEELFPIFPKDVDRAVTKGIAKAPPRDKPHSGRKRGVATRLEPDRDQIEIFVDALFRYAGTEGYITIRPFFDDNSVSRISTAKLKGGLRHLIDVAEDDARRAANNPKPVVFCPPIAVFNGPGWRARQEDLFKGLVLSVECDQRPDEALNTLEKIAGSATLVVKSGGQWIDPNDIPHDKLHLHWRLNRPAMGDQLARLKQARRLAAAIVGGDTSNVPTVHCLRWPGSFHRKSGARLCHIAMSAPDVEIDLDEALLELEAAAPKTAQGNGRDRSEGQPEPWGELAANIIAGKDLHQSIARLAAKYARSGTPKNAGINQAEALMNASAAHHERPADWKARFNDIERAFDTAYDKFWEERETPKTGPEPYDRSAQPIGDEWAKPNFRTLGQFISEFRPISYLVAGLMREGSLYTCTGRTGEGKTAFLVMLALAIATGRDKLFGRKVKKGRVAFATAENPDDLRMRLMIASFIFNIDPAIIDRDLIISDNRVRPEEINDWLRATGAAFTLVIIDTWQAYFDGINSSNPAEAVAFTRRFRPLATIAGAPVVIIAAHPIKNASDESLIPYGGGSTLNEVDGNFTILRDESGLYAFHWLGKIRGLSFDPLHFKIDRFDSPDVVTIEGDRVPMPLMSPIGEEAVEERKTAIVDKDIRLLQAVAEHPGMPVVWLAKAANIARGSVDRMLKRLAKKRPKIIEETLGKWVITEVGKRFLAVGEPSGDADQEI